MHKHQRAAEAVRDTGTMSRGTARAEFDSTCPMSAVGIGIDIGGTSIKGSVVDVATGRLIGPRAELPTPPGGTPRDVAEATRALFATFGHDAKGTPVGVCFPAVVQSGHTKSAANISPEWIGYPAQHLFEDALRGPVAFLNDADAAGYAEVSYGAGSDCPGVVIVTTFGTGIGTAVFLNGRLLPNTELGHIEIQGRKAEAGAALSAKTREGLSWDEWGVRVNEYLATLERLFTPSLFILGGRGSAHLDDFRHRISTSAPCVPAALLNDAGILGAAALAVAGEAHDATPRV